MFYSISGHLWSPNLETVLGNVFFVKTYPKHVVIAFGVSKKYDFERMPMPEVKVRYLFCTQMLRSKDTVFVHFAAFNTKTDFRNVLFVKNCV